MVKSVYNFIRRFWHRANGGGTGGCFFISRNGIKDKLVYLLRFLFRGISKELCRFFGIKAMQAACRSISKASERYIEAYASILRNIIYITRGQK